MTIAIITDYAYELKDAYREGVVVYVNYLCKGLLDADPNIKIEFWQYSFNTQHMKRAYRLGCDAYPSRVSFHDEGGFSLRRRAALFCVRVFFKIVKIIFRFSSSTINDFFKRKIIQPPLAKTIKRYSKANIFYTTYFGLPLTAQMDGLKILQVHDIYRITLRDLFARENSTIDIYNRETIKNLTEYAKKGAYLSCFTAFTRSEILKYVPNIKKEQIHEVRIPPMIGEFRDIDEIEVEKVKEKYGISGAYTFMASQNRPNKNWGVLFKALDRLRREGVEIMMVTTGKISEVKECSRLYDELKLGTTVVETGPLSTEDLAALYKGAALAVVPTMIEGHGISMQGLEALKAGVPVIHSKALGIENSLELVGLNFETADLNWFECGDAAGLAEKIKEVLADRSRHIEKQRHILKAYTDITWEDTAREYVNIFKKNWVESKGKYNVDA